MLVIERFFVAWGRANPSAKIRELEGRPFELGREEENEHEMRIAQVWFL